MSSNWGSYVQGGQDWELLETVGIQLNNHISCGVHYPAYDKRLFECHCGIIFPRWAVEAAINSADWSDIDKLHKGV